MPAASPGAAVMAMMCSRPLKAILPRPAFFDLASAARTTAKASPECRSRDDEVGLLKVLGRELVERDELLDFDGVLGGHAQIGDFGRLDDDVLVLAVFVALYDLILLDRRSGFARGSSRRRPGPSGGARARRWSG